MVVAYGTKISKLVAVEGGHIELFLGACTTTQRGDGRLRFPLGPLTPAGKREEKTKENEGTSEENGGMTGKRWEKNKGKSLKTGGKWRNARKKVGKKRQKRKENS